MPWHEDITGALPPPEGDTQRDLRRDIIDELVDHLECATRRELRRTDDLDTARRAVLRRFGNPRRIACRLWFDALKESIMSQRVSLITNVVLAVVCIVLAVFVFMAIRQGEERMAMFLAEMRMLRESQSEAGEAAAPVWAEAVVTVRRGSVDGPPIADCEVELTGSAFDPGKPRTLRAETSADGTATFGPIRPGGYVLRIITSDPKYRDRVDLYAGHNEFGPIVQPVLASQPADVSFEVRLPESVQEVAQYVGLVFKKCPHDNYALAEHWYWEEEHILLATDGRAMRMTSDASPFDISQDVPKPTKLHLAPDEIQLQQVIMLDGTFDYRLRLAHILLDTPWLDAAEGDYVYVAAGLSDGYRNQGRLFTQPHQGLISLDDKIRAWLNELDRLRPGDTDSSVWGIDIPEWFADIAKPWVPPTSTSGSRS